MAISVNHGPLIEMGIIDGATYEVRGEAHPMLYLYRKVGERDVYFEKVNQFGGMPVEQIARQLLAELPVGKAA